MVNVPLEPSNIPWETVFVDAVVWYPSLAGEGALYINLIKNETDNMGIAVANFLILDHHWYGAAAVEYAGENGEGAETGN